MEDVEYEQNVGYSSSKLPKSHLPELDKLNLPDDVKEKAESIFYKLNQGTRRSKKRKQQIFICIYYAKKILGVVQDPKKLADEIGLKSGDVAGALSMFSELQTGFEAPLTFVSPLDYIDDYCSKIGLSSELTEECKISCAEIIDKDDELLERSPQTVAAGLVRYFLFINGIAVADYSKVIGFSDATINNMYNLISEIDNNS
jgi:transcription initiation factor TFIIIB Brf1 subunit/transcription initiation factor TFIIB